MGKKSAMTTRTPDVATSVSSGVIYAAPRSVSLHECSFYHSLTLPGYGEVPGEWDLRGREDTYLGHLDLRAKRILEVGAASGGLTFHMERRGADVVAFDLSENHPFDVVPYDGRDDLQEKHRSFIRRINNGWWFAHECFRSEARMVYGTVYEIPSGIGPVDVATVCSVLLHVRDPFLALQKSTAHASEVIVTDRLSVTLSLPHLLLRGIAFLPNPKTHEPKHSWWLLTPGIVRRMLGVLGFHRTKTTYHLQRYKGVPLPMFTVVGQRSAG